MSWIHEQIFRLGARKRNPSLLRQFDALIQTDFLDKLELLQRNENQLKAFVLFAFQNSPFYKNHFEKAGFDPSKDWTLEDFARVPAVSKRDLIDYNSSIHTEVATTEKTFFCETSGTSGEILTFQRDELWDSFNRAAIWRGFSWYGVNPWDFRLYFWGYNSDWKKKLKLRIMDASVNRFRIFDYDPASMRKLKSKLSKVKAIEGYSSMIYELAQLNKDSNLDFSQLKMVKGTSEKVFPHYQDLALQVYGHRIINEYGSAESGIIAFECPAGNMHINLEGVFVENDLDTGGILVTNLHSRSFPVIRYALGDQVEFAESGFECPCGRKHPVIKEVTGRIGKKIWGKSKTYPSLTLYYIFKNLYFNKGRKLDFQAHQFEKGVLQIWLKEPITSEVKALIETEAKCYYSDVTLELIENHDFRQKKGKLRDFISHLD